jgi:hypothetical protein
MVVVVVFIYPDLSLVRDMQATTTGAILVFHLSIGHLHNKRTCSLDVACVELSAFGALMSDGLTFAV